MKYILGVFGIIVALILMVVLIIRIRPNQSAVQNQTGDKQIKLLEYEDKSATAQMTIRGKIQADEDRRAIRISVSRNERVIEILEGYNETAAIRRTYPNNDNSYKVFLSALEIAGFSREKETDIKDDRGVCPLSKRYSYKLSEGSEQLFRTWSSDCSTQRGSFGGNRSTIHKLFERQIPDYRELTRTVRL